jgi:transcription elongation factor Elf1
MIYVTFQKVGGESMGLIKKQECPWCEHEPDQHKWEWEEGTHYVTCDRCKKEYEVNTQYKFMGFEIYKHEED